MLVETRQAGTPLGNHSAADHLVGNIHRVHKDLGLLGCVALNSGHPIPPTEMHEIFLDGAD